MGFAATFVPKSARLIAATTLSALSIAYLAYRLWEKSTPTRSTHFPKVVASPLKRVQDSPNVPYPPDMFPGARDVNSPYGSTRVYEWGPENGRKVLMVHGISTPCLAFGDLAWALVKAGCRVCVYDLWGRGYSDGPQVPHDAGLYVMQISMVINSSPISWTGPESGRFSILGYSLGGGIVMSFAASFPDLISNTVLLAPGGILRRIQSEFASLPLRYHQYFPLEWIIETCELGLCGVEAKSQDSEEHIIPQTPSNLDRHPDVPTHASDGSLDVETVVRWQVRNHPGFVYSFLSSLAYAPIKDQHKDWKYVGRCISAARNKPGNPKSLLLFVAEHDPYCVVTEVVLDAAEEIGYENLDVEYMAGIGHEFPITRGQEVADRIMNHWNK